MWTARQNELNRFITAATIVATIALLAILVQASPEPQAPPQDAVACRVLEAHTSQQLGLTVVVFHHREEGERARLTAFLRERSGASVRFETADGKWHDATVLRLKSCFGRGLLLFSAGTAQLAEKDDFVLQASSPLK